MLLALQLGCAVPEPPSPRLVMPPPSYEALHHPLCRSTGGPSCTVEPRWATMIGYCPTTFRATVHPAGALVSYETRFENDTTWDVEWTGVLLGDVFEWDDPEFRTDLCYHHRLVVVDGNGACGVCESTVCFPYEWITPFDDPDMDGFDSTEDCDDCNGDVSPAHDEIPGNGVDDDCDGLVDP